MVKSGGACPLPPSWEHALLTTIYATHYKYELHIYTPSPRYETALPELLPPLAEDSHLGQE